MRNNQNQKDDLRIAQIIDANLDRAREGLRVLEDWARYCLLYTSPSPRDGLLSRMPSSA